MAKQISSPKLVKKADKAVKAPAAKEVKSVKEVPSRRQYVGAALKRAHKSYAKKFGAQ